MSDADTLRKAAELVEQRAAEATSNVCADWTYAAVRHIARNCEIDCGHDEHVDVDEHGVSHGGWSRYGDSPWITLMGPQVASPLAAWLRATADAVWTYPPFAEKWTGGPDGEYHAGQAVKAALVLAHLILGETAAP